MVAEFLRTEIGRNLTLIAIIIWQLPWKGVALWKAAKRNEKFWFIVIFIVQTLAILEILYIFYFAKEQKKFVEEKILKDKK